MRLAELDMDRNIINAVGIGHNGAPEPTPAERAEEMQATLARFLDDTPVITEGPHLAEAKRLVEWAREAMAELEDERVALVEPLNKKLASINGQFKSIHNTDTKKPGTFDRVLIELKARLTAYALVEEAKRAREAELAAIALADAEAKAREAEAAEKQAKQDAVVGVIDTGVAEKIAAADEAFSTFEHASRFSARAEKAKNFRISDGGKTLAMQTKKTLVLESYGKAIKAIGPDDTIKEAILTAARAYRKQHGQLPDGVSETSERKF